MNFRLVSGWVFWWFNHLRACQAEQPCRETNYNQQTTLGYFLGGLFCLWVGVASLSFNHLDSMHHFFFAFCNNTQKKNSPNFQKKPSSHGNPQGSSSRKLSQQNISLWAKDAGRSDWLQFYHGSPLTVGVHYGKKDTPSERLREKHPVSPRPFTHNAELILLFDLAQQNSVWERLPHTQNIMSRIEQYIHYKQP